LSGSPALGCAAAGSASAIAQAVAAASIILRVFTIIVFSWKGGGLLQIPDRQTAHSTPEAPPFQPSG
jgi:hypothetical protein